MPHTYANLTTYLTSTGSFRASKSYMILRLKCVGPDFAHGFALDSRPVTLNCVFSGQLWFKSHGKMVTSKVLTNGKKKCLGERNGRWFVSIFQYLEKSFRITLPQCFFGGNSSCCPARPTMLASKTPGSLYWRAWLQGSPRRRLGKFLLRLTVKMAWSMGVQKA